MAQATSTNTGDQTVVEKWIDDLGPAGLGGLGLVVSSALAFIWANTPYSGIYHDLFATPVGFGIGTFSLEKPLVLWINDGLMAIFFLLIGLEIKRELIDGTLSTFRKAALPLFAAVGGIAVPALFYLAFTAGTPGAQGWAIPAATDIAFALGIMALLGDRVPVSLKVFLTAVAVVDDMGAVLIIAIFYTSKVSVFALLVAAAIFAALVVANRLQVRHPILYIVLGVGLWFAVLKSGVHATVAGVLMALTIPARGDLSGGQFLERARNYIELGDREDDDAIAPSTAVHHVRDLCNDTEPLLVRMEHALQPWVLFFVMPVFAFANAGVTLGDAGLSTLGGPIALGILAGLVLGKPLGVTVMAWLSVQLDFADRPEGVTWAMLHGTGWLAGIGFTMSLFISNLAFTDPSMLTTAKFGLLIASGIAGVVGASLLLMNTSETETAK
jgi:NhaA family Na+:H+ antiporter